MVVSILVQQFAGSDRDVNVGRKKFKAISALTSVASDFDLIADWWFYGAVQKEPEVPVFWKQLQLFFCLVGTLTWIMVASDGRFIRPFLKLFNVRRLATGHLLFVAVVLEDLPQIVITLFIEKILDNGTSTYALLNFLTAGYDILIKLAEAYDERNDVHDTGGWLLKNFVGHKRSINSIISVNNRLFLSGSSDKTLKLWHTKKDDAILTFTGHTQQVSSVAVFNENMVVSGSWDTSVKLWDMTTGECIITFSGHTDAVTSVIALNQNKIVSGSFDNTCKLWNVDTGRCMHTFTGHEYKVNSIVKVDDTKFVTGSSDLTAKLWNISSKTCDQTYAGHLQTITSVACSDLDVLITSSADSTAKMWNILTGNCLRTFTGHKKTILFVLNFDENSFLTASEDKTMKLWEKDTGNCLRSFHHNRSISCMTKQAHQTVLTGSSDKNIQHWSVTSVVGKKENEKSTESLNVSPSLEEIALSKSNDASPPDSKKFRISSQIDSYFRQPRMNIKTVVTDEDIERPTIQKEPQASTSTLQNKQKFWEQLDIKDDETKEEQEVDLEKGNESRDKSMFTFAYEKLFSGCH